MPPALPSATRVKKFVIDNFLVCGFSLALLFGLTVPAAGKELASWEVSSWSVTQTICVVIIFIISGATLKTEEISSALASGRRAYVYGAVSILGLTPVLGLCIGKFTHSDKFKLMVGALDLLAAHAKYKVRARGKECACIAHAR